MENSGFYEQEEAEFANSLGVDEKTGFNIFVSVRNGEMTPIQAFKKIQEYAEEISV